MQVQLYNSVSNIIILGAGSSVDYNMPIWDDLCKMIKSEIFNQNHKLQFREEILQWIDKVGPNRKYKTIDDSIRFESISNEYPDGAEIENELFLIIRDLFSKVYKNNEKGWIANLNKKIINNSNGLENTLAFINFNYDDVLEKNFLDFSYLHPKQKRYNYKSRLSKLSDIEVHALYPHGKFSQFNERHSHLIIRKNTMKSDDGTHLDVVCCYESEKHEVFTNYGYPLNLYIMGLGGGLKINLDNISFINNKISNVHVTVHNPINIKKVKEYLSIKYKNANINVYSSCNDLINKCF